MGVVISKQVKDAQAGSGILERAGWTQENGATEHSLSRVHQNTKMALFFSSATASKKAANSPCLFVTSISNHSYTALEREGSSYFPNYLLPFTFLSSMTRLRWKNKNLSKYSRRFYIMAW